MRALHPEVTMRFWWMSIYTSLYTPMELWDLSLSRSPRNPMPQDSQLQFSTFFSGTRGVRSSAHFLQQILGRAEAIFVPCQPLNLPGLENERVVDLDLREVGFTHPFFRIPLVKCLMTIGGPLSHRRLCSLQVLH